MEKLVKNLSRPIKKRWLLAAIAIVIALLIGWWAYDQHRARPLDDNFEYLGKSDYGCWLIPMCAEPGSIYYYGTDLSSEEMSHYFKETTHSKEIANDIYVDFTSPEQGFSITYENKKTTPYTTHKKYIVSLNKSAYSIAIKRLP